MRHFSRVYEVDTSSLPPKSQMRAGILEMVWERDDETDGIDRAFWKDDLEAIAAALDG